MWKINPCNQCPKAFSESGSLKKHLRINSGEKPYPCNQCPEGFSESGSLKKHLRMHSGEKPYPCIPKAVSLRNI